MKNPIIQRELIGLLRTRRAFALQVGVAVVFALLVVLRWPSDAQVELSGAQSRQVFQLFGYGLLTVLVLLVPAFPATTIVRERLKGTMALLLNSPMGAGSIYLGKMLGVLGFVVLLLVMSVPAATACYAMGGISLTRHLMPLYAILLLVAVQYSALGLAVSSYAGSTDSALRISYGLVLLLAVVALGPHLFLQGKPGLYPTLAAWLRCVSPIPAVMEVMGHGDVGSQGLMSPSGCTARFALLAVASVVLFSGLALARLNYSMFDRARPQGVITDDRSIAARLVRRMIFVVDPQRRKRGIGLLVNPVMVKEFRSRRFGRSHWTLRLIALCALVSLGLTYAATSGTLDWGVDTIGGIMVILQMALIVLLAPSLAAGLISTERESGGWQLLMMTPLRASTILMGKMLSVAIMLVLILLATLPGYLVMLAIRPELWAQVSEVLICLGLMSLFAMLLSAAVSSFFRRTAPATVAAYTLLLAVCLGTMLFWLGRDAPFGHDVVQRALVINPVAAALSVIELADFAQYDLVPANWWCMGYACVFLLVVLVVQTWRLCRPQ